MFFQMAKRLLLETDKRRLWKLAWNLGLRGMLSVQKHKAPSPFSPEPTGKQGDVDGSGLDQQLGTNDEC